MLFLVDTLSFRVASFNRFEILEILGLDGRISDWEDGVGFNGYPNAMCYNGIKIAYNGQRGFECYVHMSGKGCRAWEDNTILSGWNELLEILSYNKDLFHMARIDIACDDYSDDLRIDRLIRYKAAGKYSSRCTKIFATIFDEEAFYVGSPQSNTRLRIYNKKLERGYTEQDDLEGKPWYRAEFQFRDEVASACVDELVKSNDFGKTFLGKLREHIRFLSKPNDKKNSQRIPEARFWINFCRNCERVKFVTEPGGEYNLSKVERFCTKGAGSSLKTLILAENLTPEQLYKKFTSGEIFLRQDQKELIAKYDRQRKDNTSSEVHI